MQGKLIELVQAKNFIEIESVSTVLKGSSNELSEFCNILVNLLNLGIFEINQMVLTIMQTILEKSFYGVFN